MQPTARAVGQRHKPHRAPEGRKKLIPEVSLIVRNVVLLEERNKLLLKRMLPMMLFLFGDIFRDRRNIRFAHAEDAVPGLPSNSRLHFSCTHRDEFAFTTRTICAED